MIFKLIKSSNFNCFCLFRFILVASAPNVLEPYVWGLVWKLYYFITSVGNSYKDLPLSKTCYIYSQISLSVEVLRRLEAVERRQEEQEARQDAGEARQDEQEARQDFLEARQGANVIKIFLSVILVRNKLVFIPGKPF